MIWNDNPTPSAFAGGLSLSLPAKAAKSLSHRFSSAARLEYA